MAEASCSRAPWPGRPTRACTGRRGRRPRRRPRSSASRRMRSSSACVQGSRRASTVPNSSLKMSCPSRTTTFRSGWSTPSRFSASSASTVARRASSPTSRWSRVTSRMPPGRRWSKYSRYASTRVEVGLGEREAGGRVGAERVGEADVDHVVLRVACGQLRAAVADVHGHAGKRVGRPGPVARGRCPPSRGSRGSARSRRRAAGPS